MYDYVIISLYLVVLVGIGTALTFSPFGTIWTGVFSTPARADALAFLLTVFPVSMYFAISEAGVTGATWGKRRTGIQVVTNSGNAPGLPRTTLRAAVKFLPWQLAHTAMLHIPGFPTDSHDPPTWTVVLLSLTWLLVFVYILGIFSFSQGRTVHDLVSRTRVVRVSASS